MKKSNYKIYLYTKIIINIIYNQPLILYTHLYFISKKNDNLKKQE